MGTWLEIGCGAKYNRGQNWKRTALWMAQRHERRHGNKHDAELKLRWDACKTVGARKSMHISGSRIMRQDCHSVKPSRWARCSDAPLHDLGVRLDSRKIFSGPDFYHSHLVWVYGWTFRFATQQSFRSLGLHDYEGRKTMGVKEENINGKGDCPPYHLRSGRLLNRLWWSVMSMTWSLIWNHLRWVVGRQ